jgi:hypothetical protein
LKIFGIEIKRSKEEEQEQNSPSFVPPAKADGALTIEASASATNDVAGGGLVNAYLDIDGTVQNEADLITRYRQMSMNADIDQAIKHIVNEMVVNEDEQAAVVINFGETADLSDEVMKVIEDEFNIILNLLEFNTQGYEVCRTWYTDGRINYHAIVDERNPQEGIIELRYIDPRKIRKIREIQRMKDPKNPLVVLSKIKDEYYIYNEKGFSSTAIKGETYGVSELRGVKISKDAIVNSNSGLTDENGKMILSYLHTAIKPLNNLKAMEDAAVVYRLTRSTERRIFYIDVGDLPKAKAEQYLRDVMTRFKNKLVYDPSSGNVKDDRKYITMTEDFWFPRRNGKQGTEVTTLPPGTAFNELSDIEYFQKKLYAALNVPLGRLNPEAMNSFGIATEISREEVNFSRFVDRIRSRFASLFYDILEKQLIYKGVINPEDWRDLKHKIKFKFSRDTFYAELKNQEITKARMDTVNAMAPVIGKYYSNEWVRTNILNQTKEDMEEQDELIGDEAENPQFQQLVDGGMGGSAMGGAAIEAPIAPPALPAPSKPGAK